MNCNNFVIFYKKLVVSALIKVQIKLLVGNYIFFITILVVFMFVDSKSSVSVTIQNSTHVHINIFLSDQHQHLQNADLSSCITCANIGFVYKHCFALRCVEFSISPFHLGYPPDRVIVHAMKAYAGLEL